MKKSNEGKTLAWQVAILINTSERALIRAMPVWALETPQRRAMSEEVWNSTQGFWSPEPAFTLFSAGGVEDPLEILRNILGSVIDHHPRVVSLDTIGVVWGETLKTIMSEWKFEPAGESEDGLLFRRPLSEIGHLPELVMDASSWITTDDIFNSFFQAVGAPDWHGKNYDALDDSIASGGINQIEVPYSLRVTNYARINPQVLAFADKFIGFIGELEQRGCPIQISTDT